ncbi:transcription initiation protein [Gordonia sp. TBRC 11910]|uniref:Transcription initiation protein n=1 Tax=Gordonia asplenii TaxID=2725283 RepID=A0A848L4X9_9ACTN|nr:YciI family protein [Gordonia asplenii]NMO04095.1 transcription initiation protein [Gordonia asplenii]
MNYFALLIGPQTTRSDAEMAELIGRYQTFQTANAAALSSGDALGAAGDGARIVGGGVVTDGPFAEGAEVAGGFYVLDVDDLDAAIDVAKQIPAATDGAVELWPMAFSNPIAADEGPHWIALLREPAGETRTPGSPEWEASVAEHKVFGETFGTHVHGGGALHPASTATTVRVRDGKSVITDGPYIEGAEVANGFYVIGADDQAAAVEIARHIPASGVEVRGLLGMSPSIVAAQGA